MQKAEDKKTVDYNDFWLIKNNPLSKTGVFPYLGSQISPELEADKIYMVYRPEEELSRPEVLETFKLIPITDEHTMLGTGAGMMPAEEKGVHGVTGENPEYHDGLITCDIKIYSEQLKQEIENGKKDLSVGYFCRYELMPGVCNGQPYDAIQRDIKVNHIALVDEGRMGKDVRVMDSNINIKPLKEKTDMEENKTCDEDKREILREADAIAMKPASEFEGGEEEKFRTLTKKLEELSYKPSETGSNDEDPEIKEGEDEDAGNGEAETKKSDEDNKSSESQANDEDEDEKSEEEKKDDKSISMDEAVKYFARRDELVAKIRPIIGDNVNYGKMTIKEVVKYACDKLSLKNSEDALRGYIKAKSEIRKAAPAMDAMPEKSDTIRQYVKGE